MAMARIMMIVTLDNNTDTDKFILFGWASLNGDWPNSNLPASLVDVVFNVSWEAFDQASITTPINFSKVSTTEGYNFEATNYSLNVLPATWDFDGNGQADALTDGLILLRHAFGISGSSLTDGVISLNATMTPGEVGVAVKKASVIADIDGNGHFDALTDGLLLLRYMFDINGEALTKDVVSASALRSSSESIGQYIELYMPNNLLSPVQSEQSFIVGDWKLASIPEERDYELGVLGEWSTLSGWDGYTQSIFDTCVADDIYRFGDNGTFEYLISGSTYMHDEINPLWNYDNPNSYCTEPFAPWNESEIYTYNIDENNSLLTVIGRGAYIALAHVANGTNDIYMAALAPESISYNFNKISESQIILELDAFGEFYRFTLEKVVETDNSPETECYEHRSYQNNVENSHTEIFQSFSRLDQNSVKVSIVSANDDPVDYLNIINLTGPSAFLSDLSISNGEASLIMSWLGGAPDSASLDVVWSKESYDGNWVNDKNFLPHIDLTVNCDALH
jgi:hypothetical protein